MNVHEQHDEMYYSFNISFNISLMSYQRYSLLYLTTIFVTLMKYYTL